MTGIALAIDIPSLDELLLLEALGRQGTPVAPLYPYVQALPQLPLRGVTGVFNRLQHRYRRLRFSSYLRGEGVPCFHDYGVEAICHSKVSQKQAFAEAEVPAAAWFLGEFPLGRSGEGFLAQDPQLLRSLVREIEKTVGFPAVLKSTESSRGSSLALVEGPADLEALVRFHDGRPPAEVPLSLFANPTNPEGFFVETYLPHALDLRCMVAPGAGDRDAEFLGCFARVAEAEERVVKTVIGGATAVGLDVPAPVRELSLRCARAVVDHAATAYGSESSAVLLGVDIIARSEDAAFRGEVYQAARDVAVLRQQAVERAETLGRVIANLMETHGRDLMSTLSEPSLREAITSMDRSYLRMAESHEYRRLQATVLEYLQQADLFVGEVNARMDFGTHCRALSVPDVAEKMAAVAARV